MITGSNHNIRYKGKIFHIQTEDSGLKHPHIISHLYVGGNILATRKKEYAELLEQGLSTQELENRIQSLMKEQHISMLKGLKSGDFDDNIAPYLPKTKSRPPSSDKHVLKDTLETKKSEPSMDVAENSEPTLDIPVYEIDTLLTLLKRPILYGWERRPFLAPPSLCPSFTQWPEKKDEKQ